MADYWTFGFSGYDGNESPTLNFAGGGSATILTNQFQGWVSNGDFNPAEGPDGNTNCFTGAYSGKLYNDYFVFDLSGVSGKVTSASLNVTQDDVTENLTWSAYAPTVPASSLYDASSPTRRCMQNWLMVLFMTVLG